MIRATILCSQLCGMDPGSRHSRHCTEKCCWGHKQPWQEICAIQNTTVSKSSQRQSSSALDEGCLNQEGDGQELRQHVVKRQKEECGAMGGGKRRTSTSSGSCSLGWEDVPRQGPH